MDFTIVGAGAIGGVLGAHLARAGHGVLLVDRDAAHVDAIRKDGLAITGAASFVARVPAVLPAEVTALPGVLVIAVKALHTEEALRPLVPRLAPGGYVLSMQNGLEAERIAALVGPARTVAACLTFGAYYDGPGRVVYSGPGTLVVGELEGPPTPRVEALARALADFHPAEASANVAGLRWAKLVLGAVYFATATVDADVVDILDRGEARGALGAVAAEAVAVAAARGIRLAPLDGFDPRVFAAGDGSAVETAWAAQRAYWRRGVTRRTGIWRDLAIRRRRTEAGPILGALIAAAGTVGQAVPRLRRLLGVLEELEAGRRAMCWENLAEVRG